MEAQALPQPPIPELPAPPANCPYCDVPGHRKEQHVPAQASPKVSEDAQIVCPHCQTKGFVSTVRVRAKKGVSGGKATAAVLTAGVSLLAVGLSRKELVTQASCSRCGSRWMF